MTKRNLSFDEHKKLGVRLKKVRRELLDITLLISRTYGLNQRPVKIATRAYRTVDDLRSVMENFLHKDCPDIKDNTFLEVYFGNH